MNVCVCVCVIAKYIIKRGVAESVESFCLTQFQLHRPPVQEYRSLERLLADIWLIDFNSLHFHHTIIMPPNLCDT